MPRKLRIAALLLAIFAMLGVSFASDSAEHLHLKTPVNGCDVCLTAHIAAEQVHAVHSLPAPELRWNLVLATSLDGYNALASATFLTRGPPSNS